MEDAVFDAGAYRAHFKRWWEEDGRAQKEIDDDAMETIEKRLKEVNEMVTPRKSVETAMERMASPMRDKVREFCTITPNTFKRIRRKKNRKALLRFRSAACLVKLLTRAFRMRKKYFNTKKKGRQNKDRIDEFSTNLQTIRSANFKSSIALQLQLYLTNLPEHRDESQIRKIIYYLRATKAFTMFSSRVEEDLARHIGYDCYDDGRIIAIQGRVPDRFYYVISGKVQLIHQYKLQTGIINKVMTTLRKGHVTDGEEIERQWVRQSSLVCKGMVEVLVLEKHDYFQLRNTILGPPIEFLRSVNLLKDFPVDKFQQHPEAIQYKFFSPEELIADDTNQTKDVFIVKSGSCKCIRKQLVTDITKDISMKQDINQLGSAKTPSHADAMLGTNWRKMVLKGQTNNVLPEIRKDSSAFESDLIRHRNTLGLKQNHLAKSKYSNPRQSIDIPTPENQEPSISAHTPKEYIKSSGLFMTQRSKTDVSSQASRPNRKGNSLEPLQERIAYIQVDTLQQGDIFGLNDLLSDRPSDRSNIAVWSDGAEIVAINKRFFKNNANTPTMLRVDLLIRDWMSEEDASDRIEAQETWQNYKMLLMDQMADDRLKQTQAKSTTSMFRTISP